MSSQIVKVEVYVRKVICRFESVDSDKEGISSDGASDEACVHDYSKF